MRDMGETARKFTNVFVKNFGEAVDEDGLKDMFTPYGNVTSIAVSEIVPEILLSN